MPSFNIKHFLIFLCVVSLPIFWMILRPKREIRQKITLLEFREVQAHLPGYGSDGEQRDPAYFTTPRGKELTTKRLQELFGDRGVAILQGATRVEPFRVLNLSFGRTSSAGLGTPKTEDLDGYLIRAKSKDLDRQFASKLSSYLLDGKLYFFSPDCFEDPGVVFRLWKGDESITLAICYECYHLEAITHDSNGHIIHRNGSFFRDEFGGPDVMVQLAKEAFPGDAEIQAMK